LSGLTAPVYHRVDQNTVGYEEVWDQVSTRANDWNSPFDDFSEKAQQTRIHLTPSKTAKLDDLKQKNLLHCIKAQ
jgi:hypothetical protein